ncbi:MAG: DUF6345 domain-containing protein [Candidatus Thiodiazotropha lotti]|nr:DUF6345 domain-containing protein [Candidatus Thiodiazotropha lotti]MCG8000397.1 DUF6345 domain-containing protein [Candidatus Thiodiazotropha lotti]MCW4183943.1 DUF6345 domain-containing protein [Candidatus Thiodiazotropha weberae]MCW4192167.1 DUF6345 domain-containing protein [Candidatus Thiodiazotropha weberae]
MDIVKKSNKAVTIALCCSAIGLQGHAFAKDLPVYHVIDNGLSENQAYQLSKLLDTNPDGIDFETVQRTGELNYIDLKNHQYIPTRIAGRGEADEEKRSTTIEQIDFDALSMIQPVEEDLVLHQLEGSLDEIGLLPQVYKPILRHTQFEAVDIDGNNLAHQMIDTKVDLQLYAGDIPLIGPGAKISTTVGSEGTTTQLHFANRSLEQGELVPVIDHTAAKLQCREKLLNGEQSKAFEKLNITTQLVYFAPSLEMTSVKTIQPHYDCGGTAVVEGEIVNLLHHLIPAIDSSEYVPEVTLDSWFEGKTVNAKVDINGGMPPYQIDWNATRAQLQDRSGSTISFYPQQRDGISEERVSVTVTDANGIQRIVTAKLPVGRVSQHNESAIGRFFSNAVTAMLERLIPAVEAIGGITDYGTENAVTNEFGDLEQGFIDRMQSAGVTERFSWSGTLAWEQDFKASQDSNWIDNTDMTFYVGHGYGGGFTFEDSTHDDGTLDHNDATGDWGDKDLEWLALLSCQVLKDEWSGMSRFDRWKQEFDGLHLLLGFHTNAYAWNSFSGEFADNMLKSSPMTVKTAWFEATDTNQPSGVVPVVMGVLGNNGTSNMNDYFWGKGSVGPDIRDGDIIGYWSIKIL